MQITAAPSQHPMTYSVTELNRQVKNLLEVSFMSITVSGEVSNLSKPGSGHWYFSLKDKKAQVRCAMFRSANIFLKTPPENGAMVVVTAKVSLYEGRGDFQLIVEKLEIAGTGALLIAYEALKQKLTKEGLFKSDRKSSLPGLPNRIGVITSPTGAAIRDILSVLEHRFPAIPVLVIPVSVQGQQAPTELIQALEKINQLHASNHTKKCDVVIIARGGGSLEDLWAFNDEKLARTIAASQVPVMSGVGHETDFTLCDLAADVRAATPSAAAEKASPDAAEFLQRLQKIELRCLDSVQRLLKRHQSRVVDLSSRLTHPIKRLEELFQRLDDTENRLKRLTERHLQQSQQHYDRLCERLHRQHPDHLVTLYRNDLESFQQQLCTNMHHHLTAKRQTFSRLADIMHTVSPLATLSRGYSITTDSRGAIIRNKEQVSAGDKLYTKVAQGNIESTVNE